MFSLTKNKRRSIEKKQLSGADYFEPQNASLNHPKATGVSLVTRKKIPVSSWAKAVPSTASSLSQGILSAI
jgi:hypothetical protein